MHGTAVRFLAEREEVGAALTLFKTLHQRVNSRDALELDHDLAETPGSEKEPFDRDKWLTDLLEGKKEPDHTPAVTYASVLPTGTLSIRTDTTRQMHLEVGAMTEGLPLDSTATLDALVPVLEDRETHKPNPWPQEWWNSWAADTASSTALRSSSRPERTDVPHTTWTMNTR
ncbi:hypothetical protein [Streptomyces sp. NPDC002403]